MSTGSAPLLVACLFLVTLSAEGLAVGYGSSGGGRPGQIRTWHKAVSAETGAADVARTRRLLSWHPRHDRLSAASNTTAAVPQQPPAHAGSRLPASGLLAAGDAGSPMALLWSAASGPMQGDAAVAMAGLRNAPASAMRRWLSSAPPQAAPKASPAIAPAPQGSQPAYLLLVVEVS